MLKPQFLNEDIPYVYLPFVKNTIDLDLNHTTQQIIDAEVSFALNGNWNSTDWGNRTDFWYYLVTHYGHYRIMKQYTEEQNGILICDHLDFNKGAYPVLIKNHAKYDRLASSLEKEYDPLKPYNILTDEASASKNAKMNQNYAQHTDSMYETSMDSTTQQPTGQVTTGQHTDTTYSDNDVSIAFEGDTFSSMGTVAGLKNRKSGNLGNLSYADLIDKEVQVAKYSLWDIIAKDLLDNICLKIFESC